MRAFVGYRDAPPEEYAGKGITNSGQGPDYQGVVFDDGTVAVRWMTAYRSSVIWQNFETFYAVHGHPEYGTRIVWLAVDYDPEKADPPAGFTHSQEGPVNPPPSPSWLYPKCPQCGERNNPTMNHTCY